MARSHLHGVVLAVVCCTTVTPAMLVAAEKGTHTEIALDTSAPRPGTEESLRRYIDSLEKGQPNYDDMTPDLANSVRRQLPAIEEQIKKWGALKSIAFTGVNQVGMDAYEVTFEHGHVEWAIAPLTQDGKVAARGFHMLP